MVELSRIQKNQQYKKIILTVRTTKENKEWMNKNKISPSLLFDEAINDLKQRLKQNINRKECVVCGKPSQLLKLGLGMETSSFCSKKCMKIYTLKEESKDNIEVKGTKIYVN